MKKEMFKKALEHYRNQEELEEIEVLEGRKYEFFDTDDGYTFPLNDITSLEPINYFKSSDEDSEISCIQKTIEEFVNLEELNKVLKLLNPEMFFTLSNIIVVKNEAEIYICEEHIGRELLENTLGQSTCDTNAIIINLHTIFNKVKNIESNPEDFFHTVVYQFYITFLHELGHISLRDNLLSSDYSPLTEHIYDFDDEEELVEWYAKDTFDYLDVMFDIFKPFNKEYILKHFNR